jgi:uncharacterized protein (DUF302 family)
MDYGTLRTVDMPVERAIERVTEELGKEGFGVLTTIDVKSTLKKKLGEDVRPYVILGACNAPLAHKALSAEPGVGLLLPCNVVVYEDAQGRTTVGAVDAVRMLSVVGRPDLLPVAQDATARLRAAVARV